jgi:hypothetical protein
MNLITKYYTYGMVEVETTHYVTAQYEPQHYDQQCYLQMHCLLGY